MQTINKEIFFNELLRKVLSHPAVQEEIEDYKETFPNISDYKAESEALEDFFMDDYEVIFSIDEIYQLILESVKKKFEEITSSKQTFISLVDFNWENFIEEKLESIRDELEKALRRKHKIGEVR
jgi:hypothetical protein